MDVMTRSGLLLALPLLFASCADAIVPPAEPGLPEVAGTHPLVSIGDRPLPALRYRSEPYDTQIDYIGGTLVLGADSTFAARYTAKYTRGTMGGRVPAGQEETVEIVGRYSVSRDSIRYEFRQGGFDLRGSRPHQAGIIEAPTDGADIGRFQRAG
jgi:hypothetical protein